MKTDTLALIGTITGIVVGVGSLAWGIYTHITNTPALKVTVFEGFIARQEGSSQALVLGIDDKENVSKEKGIVVSDDKIIFRASNDYKKTAIIADWGIAYKEGGSYTQSPPTGVYPLPYKLEEGESYNLWISKEELLRKIQEERKTPEYAYFKTADGKIFKTEDLPESLKSQNLASINNAD